jgi:hypothetical protein
MRNTKPLCNLANIDLRWSVCLSLALKKLIKQMYGNNILITNTHIMD